jgi:hypothetical protein
VNDLKIGTQVGRVPAVAMPAVPHKQWRLALPIVLAAARSAGAAIVAPSFETFQHGLGSWRGVGFTWFPEPTEEPTLPVLSSSGYITMPQECSSEVSEVMRSCGGAVQGVREVRQPSGGAVTLNRQTDGTTFFSYGTWAEAPTVLGGLDGDEILGSAVGFGLSVSIAHSDQTRRRLLLAIVNGKLSACDVAIEALADAPLPASGAGLLAKRLQVVVEAKAWEGGATRLSLVGRPPAGGPWSNMRASWEEERATLEGNAPLLPTEATFLPGGCWARVVDLEGPDGGGLMVEVGSLSVEAGEVKTVSHAFVGSLERGFGLCSVTFGKVEATEGEESTAVPG